MGASVPGVEPVLKVLLQEEKPFQDLSKKINEVTSSVTGFFGGGGEKEEPPKKQQPTVTSTVRKQDLTVSSAPVKAPAASTPVKKKPAAAEEIPKTPPPALPKDVSELERLAETSAALAVKEYQRAVQILKTYNAEVTKIVEDANDKLDGSVWTTLKNKTNVRDSAVKAAEQAAAEARQAIENIEKALYKADTAIAAELKEPLKVKVRNFLDNLAKAKKGVYEAYESSDLSEKYWKSVETARNHFIKDIEELFPNVNFAQKKLALSKEEVDLFLVYAHTQYLVVQKELNKLQTEGEIRLRRAIDAVRGGDESVATKAEVAFEMEKLRREIEAENARKLFKIQQEKERELNNVLKKNVDAHNDHLREALELKEKEMRRKFDRELEEKLSTENANYKVQLATMIGKLKGMDDAMKGE